MGETTVKDSSAKKNRRLQRRNRELEEQQKRTNTYYKNRKLEKIRTLNRIFFSATILSR